MPPVILAIAGVIISSGIIGSGVVASFIAVGIATAIVAAGTGLVIYGVGTLIGAAGSALGSGSAGSGVSLSAVTNPLAPWNVQYGEGRVGGTVIYRNGFGDNDKYLDFVIVLAAHPCEAVDWLLLDNAKIQMGDTQSTTNGWKAVSFTPLQQTISIPTTSSITRSNGVVTVVLNHDIPLLEVGDQLVIQAVHPVNLLLNGRFPVTSVLHTPGSPGAVTFTYLAGGLDIPSAVVTESGQVITTWSDYKRKIYMEVMLGTQTLGQTFDGMINGTPYDGDYGDLQTNDENPWTSNCSVLGMTAVFLRLHYNDQVFGNSLPQISFLIRGKNDISDPRTSPPTVGYTKNSALCIADYLSNTDWGYGAVYGTEIPLTPLISAANACDEDVTLAIPSGATEPRYTCCGGFTLNIHRVEILQNLLTSCAGRCSYVGGQFIIWPGVWRGTSASVTNSQMLDMMIGPFRWRSRQSITNLFNGVKGTYVAPVNNWVAADFPRYAQDTFHGYNWGTSPSFDQNLNDDGGDRRWLDIQLPFTNSCPMAQRIAKIELLRRRNQGTGTFAFNMAGYQFTAMDIIAVDLDYFGWTGKDLEILAHRFKMEKQGGAAGQSDAIALSTEIDVQETDSSVYAWDIGEELSPQGYQQVIVPDNRNPAPPTNVLLSSQNNTIFVDWTAPVDGFVLNGGHVEVQYQLVASPEGLWLSLGKMDPTITHAGIHNLKGGDAYFVQVQSTNAAGVPSAWVLGSPANTSPPSPGAITVVGTGATYPWSPGYALPITGDALVVADGAGIQPDYEILSDGSIGASVFLKGVPPINQLSTLAPPSIACFLGTSGTIGPRTVVVAVVAYDDLTSNRNYGTTAFSNLVTLTVPSGGNGSITVDIAWASGSQGGDIYVAPNSPYGGWHYEAHLTAGTSTFDLTTIQGTGSGGPDAIFDHFGVVVQKIEHGGAWAQQVVPGSITSTTVQIAGASWSTNQWAGRVASLYAHADLTKEIEIANFLIASNTSDTLTVTGGVQDLTTFLFDDDVICMRMLPSSITNKSFADPSLNNSFEPGGMTVNAEVGRFAAIIYGTGSEGLPKVIAANDATGFTLASDWDILPDSSSIIVILSAQDFPPYPTQAIQIPNKSTFSGVVAEPNIVNLAGASWLVQSFTADASGAFGINPAFREIYLFGAEGTRTITASDTMQVIDGTILCDTSGLTPPATITLTSAIPDLTAFTIAVSDGADVVNGTDILVDSERIRILTGGNTGGAVTLTGKRAAAGTAAATHTNGSTVNVAAVMTFTCQAAINIPNKQLFVRKTTSDINAVEVISGGTGADQDEFPGGGTTIFLPDNTSSDGIVFLKFPG